MDLGQRLLPEEIEKIEHALVVRDFSVFPDDDLRRLIDLLKHVQKQRDPKSIVAESLDQFIDQLEKQEYYIGRAGIGNMLAYYKRLKPSPQSQDIATHLEREGVCDASSEVAVEAARSVGLRVAFDIGGVLSKRPDVFRPLVAALQAGGVEVFVVTDMPDHEQSVRLVRDNGYAIPAANILNSDYTAYGETCKAEIVKAHNLHLLVDDFPGYASAVATETDAVSLFTWPDPRRPYYADDFKTDGKEGDFGRRRPSGSSHTARPFRLDVPPVYEVSRLREALTVSEARTARLCEVVESAVSYVTATIGPGGRIGGGEWVGVHRGRADSSVRQLEALLATAKGAGLSAPTTPHLPDCADALTTIALAVGLGANATAAEVARRVEEMRDIVVRVWRGVVGSGDELNRLGACLAEAGGDDQRCGICMKSVRAGMKQEHGAGVCTPPNEVPAHPPLAKPRGPVVTCVECLKLPHESIQVKLVCAECNKTIVFQSTKESTKEGAE